MSISGVVLNNLALLSADRLTTPIIEKDTDYYATETEKFHALISDASTYNRFLPPTFFSDQRTVVYLSMLLISITNMRLKEMEFEVDVLFKLMWLDERLEHNGSKPITLSDVEFVKQMWIPDIMFLNSRSARFHDVVKRNFALTILPSGRVSYVFRTTIAINCHFELWNFPFDEQRCPLFMESFAYDSSDIVVQWLTSSNGTVGLGYIKNLQISDMKLVSLKTGTEADCLLPCFDEYACATMYEDVYQHERSCATAVFTMRRLRLQYLLSSYAFPTLVVLVSWLGLWLDPRAVPARVTLVVTTLLTMTTQSNAQKISLPTLGYMTAVDVWMSTCMAFIMAAMLEYILIYVTAVQGKHDTTRKLFALLSFYTGGRQPVVRNDADLEMNGHTGRYDKAVVDDSIDRLCRIMFPTAFLMFVVSYFGYYFYLAY